MLKPNHKAVLPPQKIGIKKIPEGNRIVWRKTDPSTTGYYVYRGDGYKAKFYQISPLIQTDSAVAWYIDRNANLVPGVAYTYAIAAVNTSATISPRSEAVYAIPVPRIPPIPLNLRTLRYNKGVMLVWEDMKKIMPQVTGYKVYRKKIEAKSSKIETFDTICKINETNNYIDTLVSPGIHYAYAVSSLSISHTESDLSQPFEFFIDTPKPFPPAGLRVIATSQEILIHWDAPATTDIKEYRLYRATPESPAKLIAALKPGETDFSDKVQHKDKTYFYTVSVVNLKGEESPQSDEVGVSQ
jgi:hypothetical protein